MAAEQHEAEIKQEAPPGRRHEAGVGALLKASRLRVGEDLRDVADILRIRYVYMEAIEDGRYDALPGPTYVSGFIRAYAEHLGLDSQEVVRRFKAESAGGRETANLVFPEPIPEPGIPGGAVILVGIVVAVVAYGTWYSNTSKDGFLAELVSPLPDRLAALVEGDGKAPADAARAQPEAPPQPKPESKPETKPEAAVATPAASSEPKPEAAVAMPAPSPEPKPEPKPEPAPKPAAAPPKPAPASTAPPAAAATASTPPAQPAETTPAAPAVAATPTPAAAPTETPSTAPATPSAETASSAPATTPVPEVRETPVATVRPPEPAAPVEPVIAPGNVPVDMIPPPRPAPAATTTAAATPAATPEPPAAQPAPPATAAVGEPATRILVRAKMNSWIQVRDENAGELLVTRLLRSGDSYEVPNRAGLSLSTGNAGALEILVDGEAVPAVGGDGVVRRNVLLDAEKLKAGQAVAD